MSYLPVSTDSVGGQDLNSPLLEKGGAINGSPDSSSCKTCARFGVGLPTDGKLSDRIPWRGVLEIFLVLLALACFLVIYIRPNDGLGPGETVFLKLPSSPVKFKATDYWLEPSMFYDAKVLDEKMNRFKELSSDDRGMVTIPDWEKHSLPRPQTMNISYLRGEPTPPKLTYTIAYFHHMHCIATMAMTFSNARTGKGNVTMDDEHMVHCLEVLRMAVMCFADTTPEDGENYWENTHQCRDYKQLQKWTGENAAWNWTEIIGGRVDYL